jgi:phage-related protein
MLYLNWYITEHDKDTQKNFCVFLSKRQRQNARAGLAFGLIGEGQKNIGEDIKTVELGWPVGMPVAKPLGDKLFEVRSVLKNGDQARIIFTIYKSSMILLHGFIKKSKKTPKRDLELAKNRMRKFLQDPKAKT